MIGILEQMQRCALPQALGDRNKQLHVSQLVARTLKKQHRDVDVEQMHRAFIRRTLGRMQGKAEEGQTPDAGQRRSRLRLRGHAAAE